MKEEKISVAKKSNLPEQKNASLKETWPARLQTQGITIERDSISRIEIGTRFVTDYELKILAKL